ncbi:LacI family DNA-binding transcriptional regulator [Klebsiella michiganensis]|uniref:LacI family DNA-binding transcriptional regulator n=1 Tax=Klebsiella michiganensis TaxID=1134687 RepID=UPI00259A20E3|nr:LacI family DNA-binding transcriptional regulator [Klebsiella michiganensis]MDM4527197.1 LacI family DNA-binding transcriptional regulator [Klebsiella michiganensis]MDM4538161.1 LacI family DNA-binding transcriptional regulator [Klebsiella michiganensis]HBK4600189.1 LacI family DNA-binding transcriptional regulator [Klebsiella michiganensis]HBK4635373.1 LacI family DNA-binding transcriptional regulator [Klebsiella michiganensis]HBK4758703.1 LacI family DNA-binding transcriptional regulator 
MKSRKPTRAPTLDDVARSAGLSSMTVSRALNTPQLVRPKTVEKVMQAVQATGYIPNALAGGLASRRSKLVAVVVPQINNNMFVDTIQALSDTLAARGYHMLLCVAGYSRQTEAELVATLLSRRPDGVVLTGIQHAPALKKTILNAATPVVEIWDLTPTPLDMLVGFSHEKVGETIGEYLLEKDYRRPGLLWAGDARATLRKQGLRARLAKNGLDDAPQVEVPLPASLALGRRGLAELLAGGEFDVIVCSSDTLAQGAIMEAESRGLRVPQDLAVIGFGDLDFAASNRPAITTVSVDRHAIGEQAATLLADRIEGGEEGDAIIDIGFHLVARESA